MAVAAASLTTAWMLAATIYAAATTGTPSVLFAALFVLNGAWLYSTIDTNRQIARAQAAGAAVS